jgi:cell division protein FtsL
MRSFCLLATGCLIGLVIYTYDLKIKTRALEAEANTLNAALQDESDFLALMRAEISYLSRPERIEEMARKSLKLEPLSASQLVPWSAISPDAQSQWQAQIAQTGHKEGIASLIEKISGESAAPAAR